MKLTRKIKYVYLRWLARHNKRERYFVVFDPSPFRNEIMFRVHYDIVSANISATKYVNKQSLGFRKAAVCNPEQFRNLYRIYKGRVRFICI